MGKKTPKAPPPPDPYATANAQATANRQSAFDTAALNQIGTVGPWGSVTYEGEIGSPNRRQVTTLNPEAQAAFNAQQGISRTLSQYGQNLAGQVAQTPAFSMAGLPQGGTFQRQTGPTGPQQQTLDTSGVPGMRATNAQTFSTQGLPETVGRQGQQFDTSGLSAFSDRSAVSGPGQTNQQRLDTSGMTDFAPRDAVRGPAGPQVQSLNTQGLPELRSNIGGAGEGIQRNLADAGSVQRDIDMSMFGNPNLARDQVQAALLERMNPQIQQDRSALENRLAQQGIGIGSAAYNSEMDRFQRGVNDARLAATLNAGQEQSRLFGLGRDLGTFRNTAQGQQFSQNLAGGQFANQAQAQGFGQRAMDAQFQNDANQQGFGQRLAGAQFGAAEDARRVAQGLSLAQFGAGEQERIAQGLAGQRAQQFGERFNTAQFGAGEDQRGFQSRLAAAQFGSGEQERLARGSEARQGQQFAQGLQGSQFRAAENERLAAGSQAANQQAFQQRLAGAQFGQTEDQRLTDAALRANQTAFGQALDRGQFGQQENTRMFGLGMDAARFGSAEDQRAFQNQNLIRDRALQEMLLGRQQPMNELAALLQGSPALGTPTGINPGQIGIQPGDIQGAIQNNYAAQMAQWQQANANRNAMLGNLFSLGGALGGAYLGRS